MPTVKSIFSLIGKAFTYTFLVLFVVAAFIGGFSAVFGPPVTPQNLHAAQVQGTLASLPEIHNDYYSKNKHIKIVLNEYPGRSFNIDDAYYALEYAPTDAYIRVGDSVFADVAGDDYASNIARQNESEYILPVEVYGFRTKTHVFLTLDGYCKEANSSPWLGYVLIGFGLVITYALYVEIKGKKRRKNYDYGQI